MSYRTGRGMAAAYMREGPDGLDLTRTRVVDQAATDRLLGSSLPVLRVSVDQSGEQPVLVVWRNAPSPDDIAAAEAILGFSIMTQQLASSRPASSFARCGIIGATTSPDLSSGRYRPTTRSANAQRPHSPATRCTMSEPELSHVPNAEGFLAVAVILQAFSDSGLTGNATSAGDDSSVAIERQHARAFLLEPRGDWAVARATWCSAADICPDFVRDIARRFEKDPSGERPRSHRKARDSVRVLRPTTVARVKDRIAYLRDQGVDIVAAKQQDAADVLNAGGFTTTRGNAYNTINIFELKHLFQRCVDMGEIDA